MTPCSTRHNLHANDINIFVELYAVYTLVDIAVAGTHLTFQSHFTFEQPMYRNTIHPKRVAINTAPLKLDEAD